MVMAELTNPDDELGVPLNTPPPRLPATLPVMEVFVKVVTPSLLTPPPPTCDVFPIIVVLTNVADAPVPFLTPPPEPPALFPLIVESTNTDVAPAMLPLLTPPPPVAAVFPMILTSVNVAFPLLVTPPPPARLLPGALPFRIVTRVNETVAPALMSNTRPPRAAPFPSLIVVAPIAAASAGTLGHEIPPQAARAIDRRGRTTFPLKRDIYAHPGRYLPKGITPNEPFPATGGSDSHPGLSSDHRQVRPKI